MLRVTHALPDHVGVHRRDPAAHGSAAQPAAISPLPLVPLVICAGSPV